MDLKLSRATLEQTGFTILLIFYDVIQILFG